MSNTYLCSNGERITQSVINARYRQSKKGSRHSYVCESCLSAPSQDCSHTISQKRCKELGKTELIWDEENWSWDCRGCHEIWESYKSGKFRVHKNYAKRMAFIELHDPEGYQKRMLALSRCDQN